MEGDFFEGVKTEAVETRSGRVELPILYRGATCITGIFSAPAAGVRALLPSPDLVPMEKWRGRSMVAFTGFAYRDTSIGPYNEFGISIPVRYKPSGKARLIPALRMLSTLSFETFVWKLPVTTEAALNAGIDIWGYPKFLAGIDFEEKTDFISCRLSLEGRHILTLSVRKKKPATKTYLDFNTYTVKDGSILHTKVHGLSVGMARSVLPGSAVLELGDHSLAAEIRALGLSSKATASLYIPNLQTILPAAAETYPL